MAQGGIIDKGISGKVPGKPRQDMTPQPFRGHPAGCKQKARRNAADSSALHDGGKKHRRHAREDGKSGGQTRDRRNRQCAETFGIDVKALGDPGNSNPELAQSESPTDKESARG